MLRVYSCIDWRLTLSINKRPLPIMFVMLYFLVGVVSSSSFDSTDIRWVDYMNETLPEVNVFFDRIVAIVYNGPSDENSIENRTVIAPGVLFDNSFVLTSFNPFRKYLHNNTAYNITVDVLNTRFVANRAVTGYKLDKYQIECANQVNPEHDNDTKIAQGDIFDNESPLHDLMVIKIQGSVTFIDPELSSNNKYKGKGDISLRAGPLQTILASEKTLIGRAVKFASFGFRNTEEIKKFNCLRHKVYKKIDKAVANCADWMPPGWGHFICIKNMNEYEGIGSGAMLFYKDMLFGVGSFLMGRKDESVLVFTDVREYHNLIHQTCRNKDQRLEDNKNTTNL